MRFSIFASRAYLDRHGAPRSADDLAAHDWVGFEASLDEIPQVRWLRRHVRSPRWVLRANTTRAQVVACREGVGLALLGTFVAPREPALVPVLPELAPPSRDVFAVTHRDVRRSARVEAVVEWLTSATASLASR